MKAFWAEAPARQGLWREGAGSGRTQWGRVSRDGGGEELSPAQARKGPACGIPQVTSPKSLPCRLTTFGGACGAEGRTGLWGRRDWPFPHGSGYGGAVPV